MFTGLGRILILVGLVFLEVGTIFLFFGKIPFREDARRYPYTQERFQFLFPFGNMHSLKSGLIAIVFNRSYRS